MARTCVLVTRMGIWNRGDLAAEDWLARRLDYAHSMAVPAFEKVSSSWTWVWQTAAERYDQVAERLPPYVQLVEQVRDDEAIEPCVADTRELDSIPGNTFLVARLDSDDAWHPSALDWLADTRFKPGTIVDFPNGWRWDSQTGQMWEVGCPDTYQGHFLAVTQETRDRMLHVGGRHTLARKGRRRVVNRNRSYFQLIHGENMTTNRKKRPVVQIADEGVRAQFGITL